MGMWHFVSDPLADRQLKVRKLTNANTTVRVYITSILPELIEIYPVGEWHDNYPMIGVKKIYHANERKLCTAF